MNGTIVISRQNNRLSVSAPEAMRDILSLIGGHSYAPTIRRHFFPATPFTLHEIVKAGETLGISTSFDNETHGLAERYYYIMRASYYKTATNLPQPNIRKTEQWQHQLQGYHFARQMTSTMLSMGVGTGKSKLAIDIMQNSDAKRVLLICPNYILKDPMTWERQLDAHSAQEVVFCPLDFGSTKRNLAEAQHWTKRMYGSETPLILAINYESVWRGDFGEWLLESGINDLLILDESHKIKSPTGAASKYVGKLAMQFKQRLALTGTVMPNSPLDVFGQYRALDPAIFGTSFVRFRDEYADVYNFEGAPIIRGFKNQDKLAAKMSPITHQVDSSVLNLPEPIHDMRTFELSKVERRAYNELETEYAYEAADGYINITNGLTKILRLQQLTGGFLPLTDWDSDESKVQQIGTSKQDLLENLLEDLAGERVVVFARFTADLNAVRAVAAKLKLKYGEISGKAYDKVHWDSGSVQVLGVNVQSGEGIDLTAARYGIFYSVGYSLGQFEQCVGRIRRPQMREFAHFYHLVANDTEDESVYEALTNKRNVKESVINRLREIANKLKGKQ